MKSLLKTDYIYRIFIIFAFLPLLPNNLKGLPVILLLLCSIYFYMKQGKSALSIKHLFITGSLFLILLPSLVYTTHISGIDKTLSTRLSLFVIPLAFVLFNQHRLTPIQYHSVLKYFVLAGFIYAIFLIIFFINSGYYAGKISHSTLMANVTYEVYKISQHPIYVSIFLGISVLFLTFLFIDTKKTIKTIILAIVLVLPMLIVLLTLVRKGILITLILCLLFIAFKHTKNKIKILIPTVFIIVLGLFALQNSVIKSRFVELINLDTYTNLTLENSTSMRTAIYKCALLKIKEAPVFGYGLGDVQPELNSCYHEKGYLFEDVFIYNSHNQYLSYYLAAGLLGFFTLIALLFFGFRDALKTKRIAWATLLLFFSLIMLSENILERQSGVILFSFLLLFAYNYESKSG